MSKATEMSLIHKQEFDEQHADVLYHHIAQMNNPEAFAFHVKMNRIKRMEAQKAMCKLKRDKAWGIFCGAKDSQPATALAALNVYEGYATRTEQLDFIIKRAYTRL